jgi:PAS domain S-box-containing protein
MGNLIRSMDWSKASVGTIESWPQSLKAAVRIILGSRFPMFVWWGQAMTNFYNDSYAPMLGKRHPAALGHSAFDVWADVWPVVGPQAEAVLNAGKSSWNEELLLVMERNAYIEEAYFTFSYSPVMDDNGRPGGVFCAVTEDTQRVLGQRRLRTLRELGLRTTDEGKIAEQACQVAAKILTDNEKDLPFALLYLLDGDGERAKLAGVARLSPGTKASPAIVDLNDHAAAWPFRSVAETGCGQIIEELPEKFGLLPGGAWPESPRQAFVLPMAKQGQSAPAGFLVAGLSPRLAFDTNYRDFLELAAGHVASAIANARAYEEERRRADALAELDRAKTAFFSNVSHEFRTPLTLMLAPLEETLAEPHGLAAQDRERLEVAHRNALRLLKLVNTLLDFSRIEAGRAQASYEPVDLATLTSDLASVFRSAVEKAGLKLIVDCPSLGESLYVDREMWEKIVLNLLSNAFKYTFVGEIEVRLRREGDYAALRIRDTGTGIPAEELPHVFERFHRVTGARGRTFEGSGIGLALVLELVKLHSGAVRSESEMDRGSTFTVLIPFGKAHLPADRVGAQRTIVSTGSRGEAYVEEALGWLPENAFELRARSFDLNPATILETPHSPQTSRPRVLIADDNADMRAYVGRLLRPHYEVEAVADGKAALVAVQSRRPDLVLADVMMPQLDGIQLLRELRTNPETRTLPVILLSARAGEEFRVEGLERGADDYLTKPFTARELLARANGALEIARVRRETEERLRSAEAEARRLLEINQTTMANMGEGVYTVDTHGLVTYMNPEAERLFGWRCEELLGRRMHDMTHYKRLDGSAFPIEECAGFRVLRENKTLKDFEDTFIRKDGTFFPVSYSSSPLRDPNGEIAGLVVVFQDIADRKRATEQLENTVAERTRELMQANRSLLRDMEERKKLEEQLLQAQKMESVAVLAGGVAHDFNNILNIIHAYASLLEERANEDDQIKESVTVINDSVKRGAALVQQLLTAARKGAGTELKAVDANVVVERLLPLIKETFPKDIGLSFAPEPELPMITADRSQMEQALLNLCVNARDAMPDGGKLSFRTRVVDGDAAQIFAGAAGPYVCVEVSDTGIGMTESIQQRIFEPFFTTKDIGQGTGLGLAVVFGIVKNHNGFIDVASKVHSGTTFRLYFPVSSGEAPAQESAVKLDKQAAPAAGGATILLVEDEENMLRLLERAFSRRGYRILKADTGQSALELYQRHKEQIDVVLLDMGLPRVSGREVLRKIRNENPDAKIVVTSGYVEPALKLEIDQTHARLLHKPYTPNDVFEIVQSLIGPQSSRP